MDVMQYMTKDKNPEKTKIPGVSKIIIVSSGKGGVGKTTIAVHLALALHKERMKVGIFDADLHGPNIPLMLGIRPKQSANISIPFFRVDTTPYIPTLNCFGIKVISLGFAYNDRSAIIVDGFFSGRMARQTLCDIKWGKLDFLLVDLPPGTGEPQKTLINTMAIDGAIIVTTPHEFSFMDSSRGLKLLNDSGIEIFGVIENMSSFICPNCGASTDLFPQNKKPENYLTQEQPLLGRIPMNYYFGCAINEKHPSVTENESISEKKIFRDIARNIIEKVHEKP